MKHLTQLSSTLLLLSALVACSTQSLKVQSSYEAPTGAKGNFTYQKSYDLASYPWICGLTAIFWGGGCWAYLAMPMVPQQQVLLDDAKTALEKELGASGVTISAGPVNVERIEWGTVNTELKVEALAPVTPSATSTAQ